MYTFVNERQTYPSKLNYLENYSIRTLLSLGLLGKLGKMQQVLKTCSLKWIFEVVARKLWNSRNSWKKCRSALVISALYQDYFNFNFLYLDVESGWIKKKKWR